MREDENHVAYVEAVTARAGFDERLRQGKHGHKVAVSAETWRVEDGGFEGGAVRVGVEVEHDGGE